MKEKQISFIHCDFIVCKHGRLFVVLANTKKKNVTSREKEAIFIFFATLFHTESNLQYLYLFKLIDISTYTIFSTRLRVFVYVLSYSAIQ